MVWWDDLQAVYRIAIAIATLFENNNIPLTTNPKRLYDALGALLGPNRTEVILNVAQIANRTVNDIKEMLSATKLCVEKYYNETIQERDLGAPKRGVCNCFPVSSIALMRSVCEEKKEQSCLTGDYMALVGLYLLPAFLAYLLVMSILQRRKSFMLEHWDSRPGPVIPLNLLDEFNYRFTYALVLVATVSRCANIVINGKNGARNIVGSVIYYDIVATWPDWVQVFINIFLAVAVALMAYPILACISTPYRFLGNLCGAAYTTTWLVLEMWKCERLWTVCFVSDKARNFFSQFLQDLPVMLALLAVLLTFLYKLFYQLKERNTSWRTLITATNENMWRRDYEYAYVKVLLKGDPSFPTEVEQEKVHQPETEKNLKQKLKKKMYCVRPHFRYSTRVIGSVAMAGTAVYILIIILGFTGYYVIEITGDLFVNSATFESIMKQIGLYHYVSGARTHFTIWMVCFYVAIVFGAIKVWIILLNMIAWYRKHICKLRAGDKMWLPTSIRKTAFHGEGSAASLMAASMKYAGFQVAYIVASYLAISTLLWLGLAGTCSLVFWPLFHWYWDVYRAPVLWIIKTIWPVILVLIFIIVSQLVFARLFFVKKEGNSFIAVDNRRVFHIYSFFMLYFNIIVGVASVITRVFLGMGIGLVFLERIQKSTFPRSFEKMDPGYFSYLGYLLIEHTHANPVLKCWVNLVLEDLRNNKSFESTGEQHYPVSDETKPIRMSSMRSAVQQSARWKIARNRLHLILTLIRNPELSNYRKKTRRLKRVTVLGQAQTEGSERQSENLIEEKSGSMIKLQKEGILTEVHVIHRECEVLNC